MGTPYVALVKLYAISFYTGPPYSESTELWKHGLTVKRTAIWIQYLCDFCPHTFFTMFMNINLKDEFLYGVYLSYFHRSFGPINSFRENIYHQLQLLTQVWIVILRDRNYKMKHLSRKWGHTHAIQIAGLPEMVSEKYVCTLFNGNRKLEAQNAL